MQLAEARTLGLKLMGEYGLSHWGFGFDGAKRRLGACWLGRKRITLSRHFVELNEPELVRDVILHEIAHALTPGDGHGAQFKRKAREIGCSASASIDSGSVITSPPRFVLECPHCGRSWSRYRRPARALACLACLRESESGVEPLQVRSTAVR